MNSRQMLYKVTSGERRDFFMSMTPEEARNPKNKRTAFVPVGSSDWRPVSERLPELGIDVLVYTDRASELYMIDQLSYLDENGPQWRKLGWEGVTHWMPLPPIPEVK